MQLSDLKLKKNINKKAASNIIHKILEDQNANTDAALMYYMTTGYTGTFEEFKEWLDDEENGPCYFAEQTPFLNNLMEEKKQTIEAMFALYSANLAKVNEALDKAVKEKVAEDGPASSE